MPDADEIIANDFDTLFGKVSVDGNSYVVVATRGHNHDLDAVKASLKTKAPYIGLLGSRRKKALLFRALEKEGFSSAVDNFQIPLLRVKFRLPSIVSLSGERL